MKTTSCDSVLMTMGGATSRRTLLRFCLAGGAARFLPSLYASSVSTDSPPAGATAASLLPIDQLVLDHTTAQHEAVDQIIQRRYRADAYIHVFAIPIFSRQNVGGGYAVLERTPGAEQSLIGLQFAGGSLPDRAHGLNRVGLIQEAILEQNGCAAQAAYFGFMIASGEKSVDQARKSLQTATAGDIPYAAATGSGRGGQFRCTVCHLNVPARFNWSNFNQLDEGMRARMEQAHTAHPGDTQQFDVSLDGQPASPNTFLYSMRRAILGDAARMTCPFVYNGKKYTLTTEKQADPRAGEQFVERNVIRDANAAWRLAGSTSEAGGHQVSSFEVWLDKNDPTGLPLRIEFYPKSFLKLVFEQEASTEGPRVSYLLNGAAQASDRAAVATRTAVAGQAFH